MATGIGLMIKLNIDNWGLACALQTHETYGNDDDDDDGKVKGKFTLEQATKVHTWSRCTALLFLQPRH